MLLQEDVYATSLIFKLKKNQPNLSRKQYRKRFAFQISFQADLYIAFFWVLYVCVYIIWAAW